MYRDGRRRRLRPQIAPAAVPDACADGQQQQQRARRRRSPRSSRAWRASCRPGCRASRRRRAAGRRPAAVNAWPPEASAICCSVSGSGGTGRSPPCRSGRRRPACRARRCRSGSPAAPPRARPSTGSCPRWSRRRTAGRSPTAGAWPSRFAAAASRARWRARRRSRCRRRRRGRRASSDASRSSVGRSTVCGKRRVADEADAQLLRDLVEERLRGRARGVQPRRLDVGRGHRAGRVADEHDRRLLDRHGDGVLGLASASASAAAASASSAAGSQRRQAGECGQHQRRPSPTAGKRSA